MLPPKRSFERENLHLVLLECEEDGVAGLQTSMFGCSEFDLWREIGTPLQCLHRDFMS